MREFLRFWVDDRPRVACCLFAAEDDLEGDPQVFDCQTCPVAEALDGLWPENRAAWLLSRRLFTRLAIDAQCIAWLLERETAEMPPDLALETFERLTVIYDELNPVARVEA